VRFRRRLTLRLKVPRQQRIDPLLVLKHARVSRWNFGEFPARKRGTPTDAILLLVRLAARLPVAALGTVTAIPERACAGSQKQSQAHKSDSQFFHTKQFLLESNSWLTVSGRRITRVRQSRSILESDQKKTVQ
jgi:hypothetical protein